MRRNQTGPVSVERSYVSPRHVGRLLMANEDVAGYADLERIGISFRRGGERGRNIAMDMAVAMDMAMDDNQGLLTTASITTPVQFLQNWLPGFVRIITAARKIDELIGIATTGAWSDEECVQGVLENTGNARPYGDYSNIPLSSWNANYERRTVVRFEQGFKVGVLEEERAGRNRISSAAEKRISCTTALEIIRNGIGFNGYNSGLGRTYGFLNDPSLLAYVSAPNGASGSPLWSTKTFLEICADIRLMAVNLQVQSQDTLNPEDIEMTLALATNVYQYLSVTAVYGSMSVRQWIKETYPKMRIISDPHLNAANGAQNVAYLYAEKVEDGATDDGRVWIQVVPTKFQALGVEKQAKAYLEDFANATAGVMLKRPYAVTRLTGI